MSDEDDETIDAGSDVLKALQARAARRQAELDSTISEPVVVWRNQADDASDVTDISAEHLTFDSPLPDDATVPIETVLRTVDASKVAATLGADAPVEDLEDAAPRPESSASDTSARDFVRQSREQAREAEDSAKSRDHTSRRSGLWVVLAVIFGAQIIAGGVYVALNALRDDSEVGTDEVAVAVDSPETGTETISTPQPAATPRSAPTPAGSPTPVPPTPTWRPVDNGPRSAPFTYFVEATVDQPGFFSARDGSAVEVMMNGRPVTITNPLESGEPLVLRVVGGEPGDDWAQVEVPGDAAVVWIRGEDFVWGSTTMLLQVDVFANSLRVFDENTEVFRASIGSGSRNRPTPQTSTYIIEQVDSVGDAEPGHIRLASFGDRSALSDGLGALLIEPTDDLDQLRLEAGYTTDGRILLSAGDFSQLETLLAPGAKVEIVGVPAQPTPTPLPELTGDSTSGSGGGFFGCPPATEGAPPNCYRVVERTTEPGTCAGRAVEIDGDCLILGGNPELDAFGRSCTSAAPLEIGGLCYLKVGPVPQLPGPCPAGSRQVAGECREPA